MSQEKQNQERCQTITFKCETLWAVMLNRRVIELIIHSQACMLDSCRLGCDWSKNIISRLVIQPCVGQGTRAHKTAEDRAY